MLCWGSFKKRNIYDIYMTNNISSLLWNSWKSIFIMKKIIQQIYLLDLLKFLSIFFFILFQKYQISIYTYKYIMEWSNLEIKISQLFIIINLDINWLYYIYYVSTCWWKILCEFKLKKDFLLMQKADYEFLFPQHVIEIQCAYLPIN